MRYDNLRDQEHLQKRSIDITRIVMSTTVETTSDSSTSYTTSSPPVNGNLTTARTIMKSDLASKNLKTGDLEPILEGLIN